MEKKIDVDTLEVRQGENKAPKLVANIRGRKQAFQTVVSNVRTRTPARLLGGVAKLNTLGGSWASGRG